MRLTGEFGAFTNRRESHHTVAEPGRSRERIGPETVRTECLLGAFTFTHKVEQVHAQFWLVEAGLRRR